MQTRALGKTGLRLPILSFGASSLGQEFRSVTLDEAIRSVRVALDCGINFIDTSPFYGRGMSEVLLGVALRGVPRDRYLLSTKLGRYDLQHFDFSAKRVAESVDVSLHRLGTDHVDIMLCHDIEFVEMQQIVDETLPALRKVQQQGKVRFIGVSEAAPPTIRRAQKVHPIAALQSEYSLWFRGPEQDVLPICRELGIGFVPFSPLGRGFLSGSLKDTETLAPDDMRRPVAALPGREFWTQSGAGPTTRGDGGAQTLHTGPARAGVAAREREGHRADPGHEATEVRGRERGGGGHRTDDGGDVGARADVPVECCRGKSLQRADGSSHRYNGFVANVLGATRAASGRERPSERFPAWRPRRDAT